MEEPGWNLGGVEVGVFHEGVKKGDKEEWRRGGGEVEEKWMRGGGEVRRGDGRTCG